MADNINDVLGALSSADKTAESHNAKDAERIKVELLQEELEGKRQDRAQRKSFAKWIFWLVCVYLISVMILTYICAFGMAELPPTVFVTLLGTTTATVIGIFNFVAKYLFHNKD